MKEMERELEKIVEPLLGWFETHARKLPWREDPTPYHVWVSEIMLQQTRVEAVKPFYSRFLKALPEVEDLARCEEDTLLKLWEGLGYYNRVRNMQAAAQTVMENYGGRLPEDYAELQKLKGIGSYTAGAISSIAYGKMAPAVDGNVLRVLSRVLMNEEDIQKQSVRKDMERRVMSVMPKDRPGAFNQALMELGATVCVPNGAPHCRECPLEQVCLACRQNAQMRVPVKTAKKPRRIEQRTVLVIGDGERVVIHKRPSRGLLSGLYELPNVSGSLTGEEALAWVKEQGLSPLRIRPLAQAKHIFSHVEWQMTGYMVLVEELQGQGEYLFVEPAMTEKRYPIPAAFAAYAGYLEIKLGQEKYREE